MSYENKWKEKNPLSTIEEVKRFLKEREIRVAERNITNIGNCYAITLVIEETNLFVNGKGSSLEFAKASAYGELMERLITKVIFRYNYFDRHSNAKTHIFFKDELLMSKEDYCDSSKTSLGLGNCDYEKALNVQKYFTSYSDKLVVEPFETIKGDRKRYFPVSVVDVTFGTNGMAFGNTVEEAKMQALSEVFERYCNKTIINEEIVMPEIPMDFDVINKRLINAINEVKEKTGLEITLYDASLGKGYPVICAIFENKQDNKYFVKFGAHFDINIAAERCLTEMFQGRQSDQSKYMKERIFLEDSFWRKKNMESILHTGDGYYPLKVIDGEVPEYEFEEWVKFESNKDAIDYYTDKLLAMNEDAYFKMYSVDNFCVVRYLVPEVSQIYDDIEYKMIWQDELNQVAEKLERMVYLDEEELKSCIDFISHNSKSASDTLIPFFKHRFSYNSIFRYFNLYVLLFEYYVMIEDLEKLKSVIKEYEGCRTMHEKVLSAMEIIINQIEKDDKAIKEYKFVLSENLFHVSKLNHAEYCTDKICNCHKIRKTYEKLA
ncbi:MAG: YcaO-like family protein [Coprococcus sp.]